MISMFYVQDKASGKNINASDEYVFILLYQFLGSRHAGESEKINKLIGVNLIHNHGYG